MGQEIRDRFSGAVEAFSRRNNSGSGYHGDQSRHRGSEDVPSSKDVVSCCNNKMCTLCMNLNSYYFVPSISVLGSGFKL